jgi:hypothetical protein
MFLAALLGKFSLRRPPRLSPSKEAALEMIDQISETLDPIDSSRVRSLAGPDWEAVEDHIRLVRAAAIFHVLKFRGPEDHAVAQLFMPFYRRHFDSGAPLDVVLPAESLQSQAERVITNAPGRAAFQTLAQSSAEAAALLDRAIALPILLNRLANYLAEAFGRLERPSLESFDEEAYLAGNPDVAAAVARGEVRSGKIHFFESGKAEGRLQRRYGVDDGLCREVVYPLDIRRSGVSFFPYGEIMDCQTIGLDSLFEEPPAGQPFVSVLAADDYDAEPALSDDCPAGELLGPLRWRSTLYLASFLDAFVDVENGIVGFGDNCLWGDSTAVTLNGPGGLVRSRDMFLLGGRYGRLEIEKAADIAEGPVMLAHHWACRTNYGHWMMNALFAVFLVREEICAGRLKLLFPVLPEARRQQILQMGVGPEAIIEVDQRYARCRHLLYPSPLTTSGNGAPHALVREFFSFLLEKFPPPENLERPSRVYVRRLGFQSQRRMANEPELIEALQALGFTVIAPHELDFASQIHAFSNARIVIGQFGAALWNASFAPEGSRLVEIATSNWISNEYIYAAQLTGRRFSRILVDPVAVRSSLEKPDNFDFDAPIDKILSVVRSVIGAVEQS